MQACVPEYRVQRSAGFSHNVICTDEIRLLPKFLLKRISRLISTNYIGIYQTNEA